MKRVDFFYDFSCPYAYLGHTQIEALCARTSAELVWRPFLLGGVFRAIGTPDVPAQTMPISKARLNGVDMVRWAARFDVPLQMPSGHPNRTVLALRAAIASDDLPRASKALFKAYWASARDLSEPSVVREALDAAGFDGAALLARADEDAVKAELRARTDEAIAAQVFGAPSFVVTVRDEATPDVSGELFWGQDRLAMVERALGGSPPLEPWRGAQASGAAPSGRAPDLDFYFDFSSPFAYLAATQVEAIARHRGARLRYKPFLLGALFRDIGTPNVPLFAMPEAKQRLAQLDMTRFASHWGAPFAFPSRFPMNTVKALRMALAVPEDRVGELVLPLFRAYWADDRDLASDEVLASVASSAGFDGAALLAATEDPGIKARLRALTAEAESIGVCGAPTFQVSGELYWGQDRLELVDAALAR